MEGRKRRMASLGRLTERKQRLLACACVRRVEGMLSAPVLRAVIDASEAFADGGLTLDDLEAAFRAASAASKALPPHSPVALAAWAATRTATHPQYCVRRFDRQETLHLSQIVTEALIPGDGPFDPRVADARQVEADAHQRLLEDIELPDVAVFAPRWRSDAVLSMARGMYESRDFHPIPILADALQDAGCEEETLLTHCLGPGPHVRGCWVVDLVLEKR